MPDITSELAEIRRMLADHDRRLYPIAPDELPKPSRYVTDTGTLGMNGPRWTFAGNWEVAALEDTKEQDCVFLSRDHPFAGDVEPLLLEEARGLAAALLAAINYCTDDLAKRRNQS